MRVLVAAALFLFGGYIALMTDLTPTPHLTVQAPTEESIKAEMKRETEQKQIAVATKAALVVFKYHVECQPLAELVGQRSVEERIPARVFAAMAIRESSCDPSKVSPTHDVGVWQVNIKYHPYSLATLKDPVANSKIAAKFLRACINKAHGDVAEGLHRYNGLGRPAGEYSGAIMMTAYGRAG